MDLTQDLHEAFKVTYPRFLDYEMHENSKFVLLKPKNEDVADSQAFDVGSYIVEVCYASNHQFAHLQNAIESVKLWCFTKLKG